jgi:imidazolonepropionase-like amidohydrolase
MTTASVHVSGLTKTYGSCEQAIKNRTLWRQLQRGESFLIRNARIFVGDGRVVENGTVLVKTVMPGLIDVHVHAGAGRRGRGLEGLRGRARRRARARAVSLQRRHSPDQTREQVPQLKTAGVDAIKAVLETGRTGMLFARMDLAMFRSVVEESTRNRLPSSVHTGNARDVEDAIDAGASSVEHGSFSDAIPEAVLARMATDGIAYDPTSSSWTAIRPATSAPRNGSPWSC